MSSSILIVCHRFPPLPGIGGRRWAKFAKSLARKGYTIHVIHCAAENGDRPSLWTSDVEHPAIRRHSLPRRYPSALSNAGSRSRLVDRIAFHFWFRVLPLLTKGTIHDPAIFWRGQLLNKARQLIENERIEHVIVSGAPFHLLTHCVALKTSHPHVTLIGDIRDAWTWGHLFGYNALSPKRKKYEEMLEYQVMESFDHILSPSDPILEHLRKTYPEEAAKFHHIPHCVDPDDLPKQTMQPPKNEFRMVYAGSFYNEDLAAEYLDAMISGIVRTRDEYPSAFNGLKFDLFITDMATDRLQARVDGKGLGSVICFREPLPPRSLFQELGKAHVLPVFIPSDRRDWGGTKFIELYNLRRPIIYVGEKGLISEHITRNGLGTSMEIHELPMRLPGIIAGKERIELNTNYDLNDQMLPAITDRLEQVIRDV